jgi:hypothetical protein
MKRFFQGVCIVIGLINGAKAQETINPRDFAKETFNLIVLSEIAIYANSQSECLEASRLKYKSVRNFLENDVRPVLNKISAREGKSARDVDQVMRDLSAAPNVKVQGIPIGRYMYMEMKGRVPKEDINYCKTLHDSIQVLIDTNNQSFNKNRDALSAK